MSEISPVKKPEYASLKRKSIPFKTFYQVEMLAIVLTFYNELTFVIYYCSAMEKCVTAAKNKTVQQIR